ncbi:hypothetical protein WMF39_03510 [Sorangium sp. So ce1504]|uniref:hypothetical protein n=1 Tax=Sorangium sp. So ce1504 TaxID=3133337 RepID=UPI003F638290
MGGSGSKHACAGGQGGQGGNGNPGGGGLGGPSFAIAYRGKAVEQEGETTLQRGTPGAGGPGGSNTVADNAGAAGSAAAEQEFPQVSDEVAGGLVGRQPPRSVAEATPTIARRAIEEATHLPQATGTAASSARWTAATGERWRK